MMIIGIKRNHEWRKHALKQPWVKGDDTWHKCKAMYINVHGVWQRTWRETAEIIPFPVPYRFENIGVLQDVCTSAA